jgi:hypothetical protein
MRSDMFKVLVERPRWGRSRATAVKLNTDPDRDRKHIGLKRHVAERARCSKALNENLQPLVRYLRSQRGRRWDDVFSEICAGLDTGSTVKMHVRQHIDDYVLSRISVGRDGAWMADGRRLDRPHPFARRHLFWVDPADGVLKDGALLQAKLKEMQS